VDLSDGGFGGALLLNRDEKSCRVSGILKVWSLVGCNR